LQRGTWAVVLGAECEPSCQYRGRRNSRALKIELLVSSIPAQICL
jgi:hypothetical protein